MKFWLFVLIGVVMLLECFFECYDDCLVWYEEMKFFVCQQFKMLCGVCFMWVVFVEGCGYFVGILGMVILMVGVYLCLQCYDCLCVDGLWMIGEEVLVVCICLWDLDIKGCGQELMIGVDWVELVLVGCVIYEVVVEKWLADKLWVGDCGLCEGMLFNLMWCFKCCCRGGCKFQVVQIGGDEM